jgi:signal recognition particle subunit SRP54
MGSGKRGPLAGIAQAMGFGGGAPSPEQMKALAEKMPGGAAPGGMPALPKDLPPGLRSDLPGLTGLSGKPNLPGLGGFPGLGKKK